jgi:hypothetical protein
MSVTPPTSKNLTNLSIISHVNEKANIVTVFTQNIVGSKTVEIKNQFWMLHSKDVYYLYCLSSIGTIVRAERLRWTGYVADNIYGILWGNRLENIT